MIATMVKSEKGEDTVMPYIMDIEQNINAMRNEFKASSDTLIRLAASIDLIVQRLLAQQ